MTFQETDVRRDAAGRFGEKHHSEPEVTLSIDPGEQDQEPQQPSYHMRASRLPNALHRIDLANRRLARAGIEERFEADVHEYVRENPEGATATAMAELTLNKPSISFGGWKFSTAHQVTPDGHVLNFGPDEASDMSCDYCGHKRQRGAVYTVTHPDTGETKQIGGNCMEAFLGVKPKGLWALTDDILEDEDSEFDDDTVGRSSGKDDVFAANDLLMAALMVSNEGDDFRSRNQGTTQDPATVDQVFKEPSALTVDHPAERRQLAADIREWVNAQPGDSDYISNLRGVLAGEDRWVSRKHAAIAVSAISAYKRATAAEVEKKTKEEAPYTPGFLGDVKERIRDVPVTLVKPIYLGEDSYGWETKERWLLVMHTEEGKTAKWFTTGNYSGLEPGEKFAMTATVKEHGSYKERDETLVTRAKLTPVEGEED